MPLFWLFLLLPFTSSLIIGSEHTILIQRSPDQTHGVIALGTSHEHNKPRDRKWAQKLVDDIREADAGVIQAGSSDLIPYYVFIEHAPPCRPETIKKIGDQAYGSITGGLVTLFENKRFNKSVVVNCEVRKKYTAAFQLLMTGSKSLQPTYQDPVEFLKELASDDPIWIKHCKKTYSCTFPTLTFADIFDEFEALYAQTITYKKELEYHQHSLTIAEIFDKYLAIARYQMELFKKEILEPQQTIWSFSFKLLHEQRPTREKEHLARVLSNAFVYFVDLFVLRHILLLQKKSVQKIIFYVGNSHLWNITRFLDQLNYYHLYPPVAHSPSRARHNGLKGSTLRDEHFSLIKKPFSDINTECEKAIREETRESMRMHRHSI